MRELEAPDRLRALILSALQDSFRQTCLEASIMARATHERAQNIVSLTEGWLQYFPAGDVGGDHSTRGTEDYKESLVLVMPKCDCSLADVSLLLHLLYL